MYAARRYRSSANARFSFFTGQRCAVRAPIGATSMLAATTATSAGHAPTESEVIAALKGEIAGFKVPKRVHFVDELPRNAMGKVQKNVLRDRYS